MTKQYEDGLGEVAGESGEFERASSAQADQLATLLASLNHNVVDSNDAILSSNEAINRSNDRIAELAKTSQRTNHAVKILSAAAVLGMLLFVAIIGLAVVSLKASSNAEKASNAASVVVAANDRQAEINKQEIIEACENGNKVRQDVIGVWETFLEIATRQPAATPEAEATRTAAVEELLTYVRNVYQPRECSEKSE